LYFWVLGSALEQKEWIQWEISNKIKYQTQCEQIRHIASTHTPPLVQAPRHYYHQ